MSASSVCLPLCRVPGEPVKLVWVEEGAALLRWILFCSRVQPHAGKHRHRSVFYTPKRLPGSTTTAAPDNVLAHTAPNYGCNISGMHAHVWTAMYHRLRMGTVRHGAAG